MSRREILMACLGKPYRVGASGPDAFDCFGLVCHLSAALFGLDVPRDGAGILKARRIYRQVAVPSDGSVVVMRPGDKHVGLWLGPEAGVIHALERHGVVFDNLNVLHFSGFGRPRFFARR